MAGSDKQSASQLFGKISAYSTIVQENLGKYLNKLSPYAKEYESSLDLVLDILRTLGYSEERLASELIQVVTGEANVRSLVESGYHGALNSLEAKLSMINAKQDDDSFIARLENVVKVTISSILTTFMTCSVSPFIPKYALDRFYKEDPFSAYARPVNIPTHILDFSNTLHVSPVGASGIYFYNTGCDVFYYKRDAGRKEASTVTDADIKEAAAETYMIYTYDKIENPETLTRDEKQKFKKVPSVPSSVKVKVDEKQPAEFIYTIRPKFTAESLYQTDDMNAFIWYVANRGDNYDEGNYLEPVTDRTDIYYEYNKMMWDSRRLNARDKDKARTGIDWHTWLASKTSYDGDLVLEKDGEIINTLYPILQLEPSEDVGDLEHIVATFPAQRYLVNRNFLGKEVSLTRSIYKFNSDYLRSIKIFNWKTIVMNMLYELNGISPVPDIDFNLSLSDEIIDARLSTLILNTIMTDDKEVDDSYYSFSNEDYAAAIKRMELKKYGAKSYETAASAAIQNPSGTALDVMNSVSTAATLNELTTTLTRGVYSVAGTSGSTGITKTTLSADLALESNFIYELLFAIVKPFVRAILSPQIMLLFCINLDVMGLVDLRQLGQGDFDAISDFIFRKLAAIIKKLIVLIKDAIVSYLLDIVSWAIRKLKDEVAIIILLEQMNDYIRLLTQAMECVRKFGIGKTLNGIDEVNYADIIPEATTPKNI